MCIAILKFEFYIKRFDYYFRKKNIDGRKTKCIGIFMLTVKIEDKWYIKRLFDTLFITVRQSGYQENGNS